MCCCEAPGCGPHSCRRVKGVYSHYMVPSLPLRLRDNCNLPQSDSANRWPWRPTGRSCSLSMSSFFQILTAFILTTVCSGAVIFFACTSFSFILIMLCVNFANTSTSTKLKFGQVWHLEFLSFWIQVILVYL